jgi:hypothetical protein
LEVDRTGLLSCPVLGFGISGIEPYGSAAQDLICMMDLEEARCAVRKWLELVQYHD